MIIYDDTESSESLDVETRAYYNLETQTLNLVQGLFKGSEIKAYSSIDIGVRQFAAIVTAASTVHMQDFLSKYKVD